MFIPTIPRNKYYPCLVRARFTERVNTLIPDGLFDIWSTQIKVAPLPQMTDQYLSLYDGSVDTNRTLTVEEYADYFDLYNTSEKTEGDMLVDSVIRLAILAANSYVWNVRNAFIKGGRLRQNQRLFVSDWEDAFKEIGRVPPAAAPL